MMTMQNNENPLNKNAKNRLLIIDPQNDFCDLPDSYCAINEKPALPVLGAHADMQRLAAWILRHAEALEAILITEDTHQRVDIAHPLFWQQADGADVLPFTQLSAKDVREKRFLPRDLSDVAFARALNYLEKLEENGAYKHMIWPEHCLKNSWGIGVHKDIANACAEWERARGRKIARFQKGMNPWTEHYSAIRAEVPDIEDRATFDNQALLALLQSADHLFIGGEAGSHCVRATVLHLLEHLPQSAHARMTLFTDCVSPVQGFEQAYENFLNHLKSSGVKVVASSEIAFID